MATARRDAIQSLARTIARGLSSSDRSPGAQIEALFGERYAKKHLRGEMVRDIYGDRPSRSDVHGVLFAGLVHPDSPPSGPYGGCSLVWFPTEDSGSLLTLVVGTRGLSPDEGILTRPGHRRRLAALRRYLAQRDHSVWCKSDPSALSEDIPSTVKRNLPEFETALARYGREIYAAVAVRRDEKAPRDLVQAFFDLYAYEHGWQVLGAARLEYDTFHGDLLAETLPHPTEDHVHQLLRQRRFVVIQGPPGTGKTRMADRIRHRFFAGCGQTIQFHPAVTYEDFIVGLSPDTTAASLRFSVRPGALTEAIQQAKTGDYLLVIDEVNRADLGKVLGEAIYLFEPGEIGGPDARHVRLPHEVFGERTLSIPESLYVLATMNTADRTIASMDLAIRRRFAFVTVTPDRNVVTEQDLALATEAFDRVSAVFIEHAPDEALGMMPGHAYYLASSEAELRNRIRYELLPLLDEYLAAGLLTSFASELRAVRDWMEDQVAAGA